MADFRQYYKATVIKTAWNWHKTHIYQWNRIESIEINPHTYRLCKGGKNIQWKKDSLQQVLSENLDSYMYIKEVRTHPNTIYKINSKWLKYLNIRHNTIKLWEENISKTFSDINHTNVLSQSPKAIEIKAKMNKWDLIKLTSFYTSKETINKKTTKIFRENISNDETYKGLISQIHKQLM